MIKKITLVAAFVLLLYSCGVYETIENFARVQFRINSYNNFRIADISLEDKNDLDDFGTMEYIRLTGAFVKGKLPLSFIINLEANNPNDGTGGFPATDLSVQSFPFTISIDEKEVLTGNIDEPFFVPGIGENKIIPLNVEVDLLKFFTEKSFEEVAGLVLAVGGAGGSRSRITLKAKPVIGTPVGNVEYPEVITIEQDF